jgi:hypothetical protein
MFYRRIKVGKPGTDFETTKTHDESNFWWITLEEQPDGALGVSTAVDGGIQTVLSIELARDLFEDYLGSTATP